MIVLDNYPNYSISREGTIVNIKTKKELKLTRTSWGYEKVSITNSGCKRDTLLVHRLVAMAYLPNPNNLPQVNHIDENKVNNTVGNLEWCTGAHNQNHSNARDYSFISEEGNTYQGKNLNRLAKSLGVHVGNLSLLQRGKINSAYGLRRI